MVPWYKQTKLLLFLHYLQAFTGLEQRLEILSQWNLIILSEKKALTFNNPRGLSCNFIQNNNRACVPFAGKK